jgi:hypothetical protein
MLESDETAANFGTKCKTRVFVERISKKGGSEVAVKGEYKPAIEDEDNKYALIKKQTFDWDNSLSVTTLTVNSSQLLRVFKRVVGFYPTTATDFEDPFEMKSPFTMLYHYWGKLEAYGGSKVDDKTRMHP